MVQRDIIKDEIEQLGKVLGKIISDFLNLKSTGKITQAIVLSTKQLKGQLDLNIDKLLALSKKELKEYLFEKKIPFDHFEVLAEYLYEMGVCQTSTDEFIAKSYLKKSLELLELMDDLSATLSFDRMNRKSTITNLLRA